MFYTRHKTYFTIIQKGSKCPNCTLTTFHQLQYKIYQSQLTTRQEECRSLVRNPFTSPNHLLM